MSWTRQAVTVLICALSVQVAFAQTDLPEQRTGNESEVARAEHELAGRLVDLRKAQEAESQQRQITETRARSLQAATPATSTALQAALREDEELLKRYVEQTATAQQLHLQAKEKLEISRRKQELAAVPTEPTSSKGDPAKAPFEDVLRRRVNAERAIKEAELAQQQTRTLRDQLETLLSRQKELRATSDELGRKQTAQAEMPPHERQRLWEERQSYTESIRRITEEIQLIREDILLAEATQLIKVEAADEAQDAYRRWKSSLLLSSILLGGAIALALLARLVLARLIRDPERRYTVNKAFSLGTTLIVVLGIMFIFAEQFSSLLTLLGFAVAGLAIALQEIVASFSAWFFIRGSRGYTTRDWVQIGPEFGEVVDISFLRTTIQQFQPLSTDGKPVGANPTGGLIVLMNNAVFKHTLVNYTRGYPYVWCSLTYNVQFESNWERAREILQNAMQAEREIVTTARRAKNNIAEMSSNFHIQVPSTDPVVRTWVSNVGVELTLRFLAHPRSRPELLDSVNLRVLRAIQQSDDIRFAYWTVRSIAAPPKETEDAQNNMLLPQSENAIKPSSVAVQAFAARKAS